jgi:hypothetical protein
VRSGEGGRFELEIPIPDRNLVDPRVEVDVSRPRRPHRTFRFGLSQLAARWLSILTDRARYEPGESRR